MTLMTKEEYNAKINKLIDLSKQIDEIKEELWNAFDNPLNEYMLGELMGAIDDIIANDTGYSAYRYNDLEDMYDHLADGMRE